MGVSVRIICRPKTDINLNNLLSFAAVNYKKKSNPKIAFNFVFIFLRFSKNKHIWKKTFQILKKMTMSNDVDNWSSLQSREMCSSKKNIHIRSQTLRLDNLQLGEEYNFYFPWPSLFFTKNSFSKIFS